MREAMNGRNKLTTETLIKVRNLYEEVANDLLKKAETAKGGFTKAWTYDYEKYIRYKILELNNQLSQLTEEAVKTSAEIAASVQGDFLSYINSKYHLDIDKEKLEVAYSTNSDLIGQIIQGGFYKDSRSLSERIWTYGNKYNNDIQYIITKSMAEQKSYLETIKDLEKFLKSNTDSDFKKSYTKLYNRRVDFNAQRLLRTSVNHMFFASSINKAQKNPYIYAVHWNLSSTHNERQVKHFGEDECDQYATVDEYGLGIGNFPKYKVPIPHPQCLCYHTMEISKSLDEIGEELGQWVRGGSNPTLDNWLDVLSKVL
ncbi:hypothetical protein [uncultured Clostridium sp.]|uniref:hypothetical protein n=1 Tax=uncultured Clostridium sp. TaxID=59620 RepID=UPI002670EB2D|nr:hypothetical protein [uncultured Clostridium sp.]